MILTAESKMKMNLPAGVIVGKSRICDRCSKLIKTHYAVNGKDACSAECRDKLLQDPKFKQEKKMKKDEKAKDEKKKKVEEIDEEDAPDTNAADEDDDPPVKKAKKKVVEVEEDDTEDADAPEPDEDVETEEQADDDTEPAPAKKKKKVVEVEDEEEPVVAKKAKKKNAKVVEDEEEAPVKKGKAKAAKAPSKPPSIKKPYAYRKGSSIAKLFKRLADGKMHMQAEVFKGLQSPEIPFNRLRNHSKRFGWSWVEKNDQVKLTVPKDVRALVLGEE